MTRTLARPGVPLATGAARLGLSTYGLPGINGSGVASGTSTRATATATASGTIHTKGSYTVIITSTSGDSDMLWFGLGSGSSTGSTDTSTLLDIAIGATNSEVVIVPNIAVGYRAFDLLLPSFAIPVHIPSGSQVSIRCQSKVLSKTISTRLTLGPLPDGRSAPPAVVTIGADTTQGAGGTSRGVTITVPGATNTKGAWTDITTNCPNPLSGLAVAVQGGASTNISTANGLVDVGVKNAAGTYEIVVADIPVRFDSNEAVEPTNTAWFPCHIPTGATIGARYAASNTTLALDAILYGVPA